MDADPLGDCVSLADIDGAYFGTTFPHLFFLTYPEIKPVNDADKYVPRVFGFRINKNAFKKSLDVKRKNKNKSDE